MNHFHKLQDIQTCDFRKIQVHKNSYQSQTVRGGGGGGGGGVGVNFVDCLPCLCLNIYFSMPFDREMGDFKCFLAL